MIVDSFYACPPITVTLCESLTPAVLHSDPRTVSWIRHADAHLLTAGRYTYTSDMRFRAIHKDMSEDYLLQILPVQVRASRM